MQITCIPFPISSITPRSFVPVLSQSSNPRSNFNLTSFQNPKHIHFPISFNKSDKSQTTFKNPVLAAMRSEEEADDAFYMKKCVELAKKAIGFTSPNPMVGCVIVKDGQIVGQGFHPKAGQPHAEVFALREAGDLAENATAYVSLEPCNHYGRTPPCTEALIKAKVKRVVIGMVDPNPIVSSSGISRLTDCGIDVTVGVEEDLCKKMNEGFIHRMLTRKPLLTLRYSVSVNGCFLNKIGDGYYSKLLQEYDAIILSDKLRNASFQPIRILASSESDPEVFLFIRKNLVTESSDETMVMEKMSLDSVLEYCYVCGLCSVLLDLRGEIKDLEVFLRDGIEQNLIQKIVVEVLPELSRKEESQVVLMKWLESKAVKDLKCKEIGGSVLLEGYI